MNRTASALVLMLGTYGCVHGPNTEKKSKLNYLSGDHYHVNKMVGPVPLSIERKVVNTKISGRATLADEGNLYDQPLRFATIWLVNETGTKILETTTDEKGDFSFSADLKNGSYEVKYEDHARVGSETVKVDSYQVSDLALKVHRR